jgi:hypothetical protein
MSVGMYTLIAPSPSKCSAVQPIVPKHTSTPTSGTTQPVLISQSCCDHVPGLKCI